jgi:hypothetical protein
MNSEDHSASPGPRHVQCSGEGAEPPDRGWRHALAAHGFNPDRAVLISASVLDAGRRVYRCEDKAYKIVLHSLESTADRRARTLEAEYDLLVKIGDMSGIPHALGYRCLEHSEVLELEFINAHPWGGRFGGAPMVLLAFPRLLRLIHRLSRRGVVHGDLKPENVLVDASGKPWLVDFDQAQLCPTGVSYLVNFLGMTVGKVKAHYGLLQFIREWALSALPGPVMRLIKVLKKVLLGSRRRRIPALQPLPIDASPRLRLLHEAWRIGASSDANAPGDGVCYYSMIVDGFLLPGERPWTERWELLKAHVSFRDARLLELGCNLGLLSTFAAVSAGAAVLAADGDSTILEANRLVQQAFGVRYRTVRCDFDNDLSWEEELAAFAPSIVVALSVLNWVADKNRFLRFLGRFPTVVFEGHEAVSTERARLTEVGFRDIEVIGWSERGRAVLVGHQR